MLNDIEDCRRSSALPAGNLFYWALRIDPTGTTAEIKHMVQGVHLMPLGWADIVPKILQTAQIAI